MNETANSPSEPSSSPSERHRRLRWKRDVILASSPATTGNGEDMPLHLIVLAILKLERHSPRLSRQASIDASGNVSALLMPDGARDALDAKYARLGRVDHIRDALRRLADHTKLADDERTALFAAFASWIAHDARANDVRKERVN